MATLSTLVSFNGADGNFSLGNLIVDANGDLLGTTNGGGAAGDGTVFEIAKTATGYSSAPATAPIPGRVGKRSGQTPAPTSFFRARPASLRSET